jgi:hypothetical protein
MDPYELIANHSYVAITTSCGKSCAFLCDPKWIDNY